MKKIFSVLSFLSVALFANATDEIGVKPTTLTAGSASNVWVYVDASSWPETTIAAMTLDLQFPSGWTVGTSAKAWGDACMWDYDFDEQGTSTNWALSGAKKTDTNGNVYYHYTIYATATGLNFHSQKGDLVAIAVKAPAGTADGYYPVKTLVTTCLAKDAVTANNITWETVQTSYIKVGNPTEGTLTPEGLLTSAAVEGLNSDTGLSTLDLTSCKSVATPEAGFACVDGREVVAPSTEVTVAKATYTRTIGENKYGSLCLPFDVTDGTFYTTETSLGEFPDEGGYVHFDEVTGLAANTPAIATSSINISQENVTLKSVSKRTIEEGYYLKNNKLYEVAGTVTINPYRASWDWPAGSVKGFVLGNDETGISTIELNDETGSIYDLSGRKLNKAGHGVNIVNGQKVLKK